MRNKHKARKIRLKRQLLFFFFCFFFVLFFFSLWVGDFTSQCHAFTFHSLNDSGTKYDHQAKTFIIRQIGLIRKILTFKPLQLGAWNFTHLVPPPPPHTHTHTTKKAENFNSSGVIATPKYIEHIMKCCKCIWGGGERGYKWAIFLYFIRLGYCIK